LSPDHRHAVELLFRSHGPAVGNYVLARVGDLHQAEEITARVFLKVADHIENLRGPAGPWLWAIVRNELARQFRDAKTVGPLDATVPAPGEPPPDQLARKQVQAQVRAALAQLNDDQQRLVFLKFFENMSNQDIALATGLTPSNVGVIVHRALKHLRTLLGGAMSPVEPTGRTEGPPW
jgi:RNA polymerase sigma-70 factor (ECF subfamily)